MKIKKLFLIITLSLPTLTSCSNNEIFNNEVIDSSLKESILNIRLRKENIPGNDSILSYEYFVQGYSSDKILSDEERFYSYTMNYNKIENSSFYYVYLLKNRINEIQELDKEFKYSSSLIDGRFLKYYRTNIEDYSVNELKVFKSDYYKFNKNYKNYKLVGVIEESSILVKENISINKIINKEYKLLNCLTIKNKNIINKIDLENDNYIYSCQNIEDKDILYFPDISLSYSKYNLAGFSSKIYNLDNKEYIIMLRYLGDLDYLDSNNEFDTYWFPNLFGNYKKEFLRAFYKRINENSNYGYYSLDTIKTFLS